MKAPYHSMEPTSHTIPGGRSSEVLLKNSFAPTINITGPINPDQERFFMVATLTKPCGFSFLCSGEATVRQISEVGPLMAEASRRGIRNNLKARSQSEYYESEWRG